MRNFLQSAESVLDNVTPPLICVAALRSWAYYKYLGWWRMYFINTALNLVANFVDRVAEVEFRHSAQNLSHIRLIKHYIFSLNDDIKCKCEDVEIAKKSYNNFLFLNF